MSLFVLYFSVLFVSIVVNVTIVIMNIKIKIMFDVIFVKPKSIPNIIEPSRLSTNKNNIIPKDIPVIISFLFEFLFEITSMIPIKDDVNTISSNNTNVIEKSKFI